MVYSAEQAAAASASRSPDRCPVPASPAASTMLPAKVISIPAHVPTDNFSLRNTTPSSATKNTSVSVSVVEEAMLVYDRLLR